MRRTNVYVTDKQLERLRLRAEQEGVAMAELIRRAIDAFLAWDDPTYIPQPQTRNAHSSPA
jgi:hypothetical protein